MIFLTVGSQKFPFDRLIQGVDELKRNHIIEDEIFAQIGCANYIPKHLQYDRYLSREDFSKKMEECNLLITHAGVGTIMKALLQQKKIIAIPRLAIFGEHVNNHQLMIVRALSDRNHIFYVENLENLAQVMEKSAHETLKPYTKQSDELLSFLEQYIDEKC